MRTSFVAVVVATMLAAMSCPEANAIRVTNQDRLVDLLDKLPKDEDFVVPKDVDNSEDGRLKRANKINHDESDKDGPLKRSNKIGQD